MGFNMIKPLATPLINVNMVFLYWIKIISLMPPTKFRFNQTYGSGDVDLFKIAFVLDIVTG